MTTGQLMLTIISIVLTIFGASWLNAHLIDRRFDELNRRLEEMNKRFEAQLETLRVEIKRINEDIKEIKADLKQLFKPVLPH